MWLPPIRLDADGGLTPQGRLVSLARLGALGRTVAGLLAAPADLPVMRARGCCVVIAAVVAAKPGLRHKLPVGASVPSVASQFGALFQKRIVVGATMGVVH